MNKVLLKIGTRNGAFLALANPDRRHWELRGPFLKGIQVNHMRYIPDSQPSIYAAVASEWWGPDLRISRDWGETWLEPQPGIRFGEERKLSVKRVWVVEGSSRANVYAGVDAGALFRSADRGNAWEEVRSLTEHPSRDEEEHWETIFNWLPPVSSLTAAVVDLQTRGVLSGACR
ncbi:MAG: hypothetical protein ACE5JI_01110 [Acidobacteriota bacterium]